MNAEGIGTNHVQRLADKTIGLYYITLKDGERSFTYWRNDSAARKLASDPAALGRALEGADMAYWSGITLAILPNQDRLALIEALSQFAGRGGISRLRSQSAAKAVGQARNHARLDPPCSGDQ